MFLDIDMSKTVLATLDLYYHPGERGIPRPEGYYYGPEHDEGPFETTDRALFDYLIQCELKNAKPAFMGWHGGNMYLVGARIDGEYRTFIAGRPIVFDSVPPRRVEYVEVELSDFGAYVSGALVQDAFARLNVDDREFIVSGIYGTEWDKMFTPEEVDDAEL